MKVAVDVKNRDEASAVKAAMADTATRTAVIIVGVLLQLSNDKARTRVLGFVNEVLGMDREADSERA